MPARHTIAVIVLFWMATAGWLFHRDIWPQLRRGEPPPYYIDLADEARKSDLKIRWVIKRPGKEREIGRAYTWTRYVGERSDTFELNFEVKNLDLGLVQVKRVSGAYQITRQGQLLGVNADVDAFVNWPGLKSQQFHATLDGKVKDQMLTPHCAIELDRHPLYEMDLTPVTLSSQRSILNPLNPVNRVMGLRRGQHWRLPLIDPLDAVAPSLKPVPSLSYLNAEVLSETQTIRWNGQDWPCLVIQYTGGNRSAHTWVRESDGTVLRQEATVQGDKLILERE
jgi:hypothetical protein